MNGRPSVPTNWKIATKRANSALKERERERNVHEKTQSVSFAISHIDFGWRHAYNSQNSHLSYHCWNMPREPSNQGPLDSLFAALWSNLCTGAAWVISANLCLRAKCAGPVLSIVPVFSIDIAGVVLLDNVILQSVVCSYNVNRAGRVVQTCLYNVNHTGDVVQCVKRVVQSACVLR